MSYIKINGIKFPAPVRGLNIVRTPNVEKNKNALGQIVAQKVGRALITFKSLQWKYISAETWELILTEIQKVSGTITFYNSATHMYDTYNIIWGESSEEPYMLGSDGKPTVYSSCKCDIEELGYDAISSSSTMGD